MKEIAPEQIIAATNEVTGLRYEEYTTKSRRRPLHYARMLIVLSCVYFTRLKMSEIARLINRDRTTVIYLAVKVRIELQYNAEFRALSRKVNDILI